MHLNIGALDVLWILFSGGGSSVFYAAILHNHWKTVAALLPQERLLPSYVKIRLASHFFEVIRGLGL